MSSVCNCHFHVEYIKEHTFCIRREWHFLYHVHFDIFATVATNFLAYPASGNIEHNCLKKLYISHISHYTGTYLEAFTATRRVSKLCTISCNDMCESSFNAKMFTTNWTLCATWSSLGAFLVRKRSILFPYHFNTAIWWNYQHLKLK